jgi:hypothetical protein
MPEEPVNTEEGVETPLDATELQEARVSTFVRKQLVHLGERRIPLSPKSKQDIDEQIKAAEMMVASAPGEENIATEDEKEYSNKLIEEAQGLRKMLDKQDTGIEDYLVKNYYADAMTQGLYLGDLNAVMRSFAEVGQWIKRMAYRVSEERSIELQQLSYDILSVFGAKRDIKYGIMDVKGYEERTKLYEKTWETEVVPLLEKYKVTYSEMPAVLETFGRLFNEIGDRVSEDVVKMQELAMEKEFGVDNFEDLTMEELHKASLGIKVEKS